MTTCARCGGELPRSRVHVDGKEFHLHCHRSEADWRELDRLAEIAMQGLCALPSIHGVDSPPAVASFSYHIAEAMLAERRRRRGD
jgi:hypothetical protein